MDGQGRATRAPAVDDQEVAAEKGKTAEGLGFSLEDGRWALQSTPRRAEGTRRLDGVSPIDCPLLERAGEARAVPTVGCCGRRRSSPPGSGLQGIEGEIEERGS